MKLRVGLIGLGNVGALHQVAYGQLECIEVVAVAEPDASRRQRLIAGRDIIGFSDHREMLERSRLDIACVLTPAATHEAVTLDCAHAGVHVLCEKPMALTVRAAERMADACRKAGVQFFYGASYRYLPAIVQAKILLANAAIGRIQLVREEVLGGSGIENWSELPPSHYPAGGPGGSGMGLIDHGIHLIDACRWLCNSEVTRVFGRVHISGADPDTEFIHMDLANGAAGILTYNDATFGTELPGEGVFAEGSGWDAAGYVAAGNWSGHPGSIHVYGTMGSLRIFHYTNHLYQFDARGPRRVPVQGRAAPDHFASQMESFATALAAGQPAPVGAEAGIAALRVALAAFESGHSGRAICMD